MQSMLYPCRYSAAIAITAASFENMRMKVGDENCE